MLSIGHIYFKTLKDKNIWMDEIKTKARDPRALKTTRDRLLHWARKTLAMLMQTQKTVSFFKLQHQNATTIVHQNTRNKAQISSMKCKD